MTAELKGLLEDQWATTIAIERQTGQIIPWVFHRIVKPIRSFNVAWQGAYERAGQPGRLFHDFRRTAVRNMVQASIPERVAMQMSGYKTRSVFDRYHIVSEGDNREAARKVSGTASIESTFSGTING
jgi:integrase